MYWMNWRMTATSASTTAPTAAPNGLPGRVAAILRITALTTNSTTITIPNPIVGSTFPIFQLLLVSSERR